MDSTLVVVPFPAGTLVMPGNDAPFHYSCNDHVYEVGQAFAAKKAESGFRQTAWCLVCGIKVNEVDSGWWAYPVTVEQRKKAAVILAKQIRESMDVLDRIQQDH
jgi:hypothetical protein